MMLIPRDIGNSDPINIIRFINNTRKLGVSENVLIVETSPGKEIPIRTIPSSSGMIPLIKLNVFFMLSTFSFLTLSLFFSGKDFF